MLLADFFSRYIPHIEQPLMFGMVDSNKISSFPQLEIPSSIYSQLNGIHLISSAFLSLDPLSRETHWHADNLLLISHHLQIVWIIQCILRHLHFIAIFLQIILFCEWLLHHEGIVVKDVSNVLHHQTSIHCYWFCHFAGVDL